MLAASEDFLVEAARDAFARCWPKPTVSAVCNALDQVFLLAEESWSSRRRDVRFMMATPASACKAGCGWCCHQQVGVSVPEAIRVAVHIRALPEDEGKVMAARVTQVAASCGGLDTTQWLKTRTACPFLGADGNCMIYAVRPLRCRGVHSIDVDFCIACYDDLEAMRGKLHRGELKAVYLEAPERIFDSALAGVLKALGKHAPKAVKALEMSATVAALLADPKLADRWLAGARPDARLHLRAVSAFV